MTSLDKADLLLAMSAHVRGTGLAGASLRPLAKAAGTSDRMLIYHFGSKAALMAELLDHLVTEILSAMSAALPPAPAPTEAACAAEMLTLVQGALVMEVGGMSAAAQNAMTRSYAKG